MRLGFPNTPAMFAPHPRPRPNHTYSSPSMSYRPDEYYLPNIQNNPPRTYDDPRQSHSFYPDQYYPGRSKSYDNRDVLPPPLPQYNQSYDRHHNTSTNMHMSYRHPSSHSHSSHHYVDRQSPSLAPLKRPDLSNMVDNFGLPPSHNGYVGSPTIKSEVIVSAPSAPSNHSDYWQEASPSPPPELSEEPFEDPQSPPEPAKPKKTRREKPKIALAPDQPPTTQGKPRARVYVACIQCRTRKIRCDGAKPMCHNCGRRSSGSGECVYDPVPKRRGPDKTPGARQRTARSDGVASTKRRRRRDTSATDVTSVSASSSSSIPSSRDLSGLQSITLAPPPGPTEQSSSYPSPSEPSYPSNTHPNYGRTYAGSGSPQGCGCHGQTQCPDLLDGVTALQDYRKPTGVVRNLIF